jgi:hypothetical protein
MPPALQMHDPRRLPPDTHRLFYNAVPVSYYTNLVHDDVTTSDKTKHDLPQPGYFKAQPQWKWDVPRHADWKGR